MDHNALRSWHATVYKFVTSMVLCGLGMQQNVLFPFGILNNRLTLLSGRVPFPAMDGMEILELLLRGYRLTKPASCPNEM